LYSCLRFYFLIDETHKDLEGIELKLADENEAPLTNGVSASVTTAATSSQFSLEQEMKCPHWKKNVNGQTIRKTLKNKLKKICSVKFYNSTIVSRCTYQLFVSLQDCDEIGFTDEDSGVFWMCLQCGHKVCKY